MTIRVLIADDHAVLRAGLRMLLEAQEDMTVVGEAADGSEAIDQVERLEPDVVLLDLTMPKVSGLEAIQQIRAAQPSARVLVLTMHDDESYLRSTLEAGGSGYVLKRAADAELLSAIRAVYQGGTYLHPHHTRLLLADVAEQRSLATGAADEQRKRYHLLSERESEVFELVALGYRNSEIAEKLHLSVKTVETYKTRLMQKLGLGSRAALVRYALQLGVLGQEPT